MGLWSRISDAIAGGFKTGKKWIADNGGTLGQLALTAYNPVLGALAGTQTGKKVISSTWDAAKTNAPKAWEGTKNLASRAWEGMKNLPGKAWERTKNLAGKAWEGTKKGWEAGKGLASKHSETIGGAALRAFGAIHPGLGATVGTIAGHFANDNSGWGRFAKGLSGGGLSSHLESQGQASNVSNGHVATGYGGGYSISTTGNVTKPRSNGRNYIKSGFI